MVTSLSVPPETAQQHEHNGIRPVNLRTDLGELADLIELVFSDTMDDSGRAAIREMRALSKIGAGLHILGRLNQLTLGISLGYVWIENGRLVGNVSIYPAHHPYARGEAWIIANVGVHPDYQRRGIAYRLMRASMEMIQQRGGREIMLQVDYNNEGAVRLYEKLGFERLRAFTIWKRSSLTPPPRYSDDDVFITRRRPAEWAAEYALAQQVRPDERGGVGWMKPLRQRLFQRGWWSQMVDWFSMTSKERLIVRAPDERSLRAALWIESGFASTRQQITVLAHPDHYEDAAAPLLHNVLRRYRSTALYCEHPHDDERMNDLLKAHRFQRERTLWHMRYRF